MKEIIYMNIFKVMYKIATDPFTRFKALAKLGFMNKMSDEKYIKKKFKLSLGYELNLDDPQTFNEKLQWLKLHDRKPEYTIMVDKYLAKKYVADKIGEQYIIPTLGVWDSPDEIDFDKLPNQFVLKCNHNSGLGMCICRNKSELDIKKVKSELRKGLRQNYYLCNREWPYKNVPRKIIAEKYMESNDGMCLTDYKFFCFDGVPKIMYISKDNSNAPRTDFFDMEFKHLNLHMKDPNANICPAKPTKFDEMKRFSEILSLGVPLLRVDFYIINNMVYVGELTFFHNGGFSNINPPEWDYKLGQMLELPQKSE